MIIREWMPSLQKNKEGPLFFRELPESSTVISDPSKVTPESSTVTPDPSKVTSDPSKVTPGSSTVTCHFQTVSCQKIFLTYFSCGVPGVAGSPASFFEIRRTRFFSSERVYSCCFTASLPRYRIFPVRKTSVN